MPAPGGRLSGAGHSESPSRASVISQRRGGWRRGPAMPIAAPIPAADPANRLAEVLAAIASAARTAGRPRDAVMLIAVSKTHPVAAIRPLIDAGQRVFGENRVQEAQTKWPALRAASPDISLHLIGQLQSNKADEAVALRSEEHTSELQSLMRLSYAVFCLKNKNEKSTGHTSHR